MSDSFFEDPNSFSHQLYELGIESLHPSPSVSVTNIISSSSSLTNFSLEMQATPMENKNKSRKASSINLVSAHSKSVMKESGKGKRKRELMNGDGVVKKKEDSSDSERKKKIIIIIEEKMKDVEDNVVGYIHVRREKISERMKILQGLVPGCDKVSGKALILDEIINYVQSLQNQVEFLCMKLASDENPMLYDGDLDILHAPNTDIKMQQWNPTMSSGAVAKSDLTMPTTLPISISHDDYQFIATSLSTPPFA